jgi:hypothetical protein
LRKNARWHWRRQQRRRRHTKLRKTGKKADVEKKAEEAWVHKAEVAQKE